MFPYHLYIKWLRYGKLSFWQQCIYREIMYAEIKMDHHGLVGWGFIVDEL